MLSVDLGWVPPVPRVAAIDEVGTDACRAGEAFGDRRMHGTLYLAQAPQVGRTSSHLVRFSLHRRQPSRDLVCGLRVAISDADGHEIRIIDMW